MSGFVMTQLVDAAHTPGASRTEIDFQSLADLTHWQNQAYANVYTGLAAARLPQALFEATWGVSPSHDDRAPNSHRYYLEWYPAKDTRILRTQLMDFSRK